MAISTSRYNMSALPAVVGVKTVQNYELPKLSYIGQRGLLDIYLSLYLRGIYNRLNNFSSHSSQQFFLLFMLVWIPHHPLTPLYLIL